MNIYDEWSWLLSLNIYICIEVFAECFADKHYNTLHVFEIELTENCPTWKIKNVTDNQPIWTAFGIHQCLDRNSVSQHDEDENRNKPLQFHQLNWKKDVSSISLQCSTEHTWIKSHHRKPMSHFSCELLCFRLSLVSANKPPSVYLFGRLL